MRSNDAGAVFVDSVMEKTCNFPRDSCCLRVEVTKCCNTHGRSYAIQDGVCASREQCDAAYLSGVCSDYKSPRLSGDYAEPFNATTDARARGGADHCDAGFCGTDLCNVLGASFENAASRAVRWSVFPIVALCVVVLFRA